MIIEIIEYVSLIGLGGLIWYYLEKISNQFIDNMVAKFPSYYNMSTVNFIKAVNHWFLFFMILGAGYALYIVAQRSKTPEGYYYG